MTIFYINNPTLYLTYLPTINKQQNKLSLLREKS